MPQDVWWGCTTALIVFVLAPFAVTFLTWLLLIIFFPLGAFMGYLALPRFMLAYPFLTLFKDSDLLGYGLTAVQLVLQAVLFGWLARRRTIEQQLLLSSIMLVALATAVTLLASALDFETSDLGPGLRLIRRRVKTSNGLARLIAQVVANWANSPVRGRACSWHSAAASIPPCWRTSSRVSAGSSRACDWCMSITACRPPAPSGPGIARALRAVCACQWSCCARRSNAGAANRPRPPRAPRATRCSRRS